MTKIKDTYHRITIDTIYLDSIKPIGYKLILFGDVSIEEQNISNVPDLLAVLANVIPK